LLELEEIWLILKVTSIKDKKISSTRRKVVIPKKEVKEHLPDFTLSNKPDRTHRLLLHPNPEQD
jgi:hypothetical protein